MIILEELKKRSQLENDSIKIDLKLYNLIDDIEKEARNHLKRVITVLPEFDIHDEKHSERVIKNIEELLGNTVGELSSYELFLLHSSAFLHDCGMAPSEYEINVMKLTEGNEKFYSEKDSIKHDLRPPLKHTEALNVITSNKELLYKNFSLPSKWIFCNSAEKDFISYLAELLLDYQNFRNGFAKELKSVDNIEDFKSINEFIRIDYIRATHHIRIETYIKNLETKFGNAFEQPSWGKKLANDLAKICRSHGENIEFIEQLSVNSQYYGSSSANLQMISMMLRLGDIIHYSFDRAPLNILSSKIFKSEYSFQEWAVKNSGANYSIENGLISYRAYCENPETYFKLHEYIDWIEVEIQNYFKFQRKWKNIYIEKLHDKVERTNISNDESEFLPRRGLGFSLNQKKILELLKGVGLYKDEYACLRELYQNSLDACRCMISKKSKINIQTKGQIQFGVEENEVGKYVYCLDNGIGMSKDIIEKYLLNIGNSYYNSSDFYKEQSKWDGGFTPTSQFGIGILSCFMIGTKIEIVTKSEGGDYISCIISGIHDNFYYKQAVISDREKIIDTGTLVKVYLNDKTEQNLEYSKLKKFGLLLLGAQRRNGNDETAKMWQKHIYKYISGFISVVPDNIEILVRLKDEQFLPILTKPLNVLENKELLQIDIIEDKESLNNFLEWNNNGSKAPTISQIQENISTYPIKIKKQGINFTTFINLPNRNIDFSFKKFNSFQFFLRVYGISIDGISIDDSKVSQFEDYFTHRLIHFDGHLDFTGELRPIISIDRKSIIKYPKECESLIEEISLQYIKEVIEIAKQHIEKFNILNNTLEFNIVWDYVLDRINFADVLFINELSETEYGDVQNKELSNLIGENISIKEFIDAKRIDFHNFNFKELSLLTQKLILSKLISADSINIKDNVIEINMQKFNKNYISKNGYSDIDREQLLFKADKWDVFDEDFDLITGLYPLIPKKMFDELNYFDVEKIGNLVRGIHNFSNGLLGVFSQSPQLIHSKLGLYLGKSSFGRDNSKIYNFSDKRSNIAIFELNDRYAFRKEKRAFVLMVFVSPVELSELDKKELLKHDHDSDYIKGINEGWSLLITSMDKDNVVIISGKATRSDLVNKLSNDFWEEYKDYEFKFIDGTLMTKKK
ncbi:ATP-binding protein [Chryseobacterium sp. RG1]|uniref:ATP-binding protein n=1 Tax=Chryseobacterium tagetis TaxID=2801334 RepID=A0ABS8A6E8_9FLAO|nr:ATP-binding protein [Chryseobacterium tagetis]MCA6068311.1 ATP-binding protein [Chryseobacterium tagetis]